MTSSSNPTSPQHEGVLKSEYLSRLPGEVRARALQLTAKLSELLKEWVKDYEEMRPVRVPQICLTLAVADPSFEPRDLLPCARLVAWIFAVDDLVDEELESPARAWERIERCMSLLEGDGDASGKEDPLYRSLWEVHEELSRLPHFSALREDWVESMRKLLDGMKREQEWSTRYRQLPEQPLPTFSQYIENGKWSIGVPPILFCSLMAMREVDVSMRTRGLTELESQAAICVRLANDLRSYEREAVEGKVNALALLQREAMQEQKGLDEATALEQARLAARRKIQEGLKRCLELAQGGRTSPSEKPARPELFRLALAGFACDFYIHHDYHHALSSHTG